MTCRSVKRHVKLLQCHVSFAAFLLPSHCNPVALTGRSGGLEESEIDRSLRTWKTLDDCEIDNGHGGCAGYLSVHTSPKGKMQDRQVQKKKKKPHAIVKHKKKLYIRLRHGANVK